jgi:hypothetical protein
MVVDSRCQPKSTTLLAQSALDELALVESNPAVNATSPAGLEPFTKSDGPVSGDNRN